MSAATLVLKKDSSNLKTGPPTSSCCTWVDIAYNKMRAWQGAVGVSAYQGIVSPAYAGRARARRDEFALPSLPAAQRYPLSRKRLRRWSYGITSDMWSEIASRALQDDRGAPVPRKVPTPRRTGRHRPLPRPRRPADQPLHPSEAAPDRTARGGEAGHHPPRRDAGPRSQRAPQALGRGVARGRPRALEL